MNKLLLLLILFNSINHEIKGQPASEGTFIDKSVKIWLNLINAALIILLSYLVDM